MRRQRATRRRRTGFLAKLAEGFSVSGAAAFVGVHRSTLYRMRQELPGFAALWDEAIEEGTDALEDELLRRAAKGILRPVFYRGKRCGSIREFSDQLLIVALRARRPQKYRENVQFDIDRLLLLELERVRAKEPDGELASEKIQ